MKRIILVIALVAIAIGIYFYTKPSTAAQGKDNGVTTVAVSPVQVKNVTLKTQAIGTVNPIATVSLKSLVDGQILSVNFKEGDMVKAGQTLINIDPRPFQVQLQSAEANLAKDQAQLVASKSLLARNAKLLPDGYVSKQDFEQLRSNTEALEATIKADQAAVDNAKLQLSYCTITAPISGRTGSLLIQPGNLVKANDTNALVIINQISPIYVTFSLPQQQLYKVRKEFMAGPVPVTINLDKSGKKTLSGVLTFIDNTVNTTTGTIELKATIQNDKQQLWPGQFVTVKLDMGDLKQALVIPTIAVQAGPNGEYVYVVNRNDTVSFRPVQIGANLGNLTVIKSGLKPNEQVVTAGQLRLVDGSPIQIAANNKI